MSISPSDRNILRDLAKQQLELAKSPKNESLIQAWKEHGAFKKGSRPMIMIELGTFAPEILPPLQKCEGDEARKLEWMLLSNIVNRTLFDDDTIVNDYLPVSMRSYFVPFGLEVKVEHAGDSLGHHFIPYLHELEEDIHLLKKSTFGVDRAATLARVDYLNEIFGDILPARITGHCLYSCPTQAVVHIMSMEDMFVAMMDEPELFLKMMDQYAEDTLEYFDLLEKEGAVLSTTENEHLAQGSYCYTDELEKREGPMKTNEIWGYLDSQETSGVSPQLFHDLVWPCYKKIAARYGLLSYGCCEAVNGIWENCLSELDNLRKVSISPWCDEEYMGERLRGRRTVYLRKPTPNLIGVGSGLDEEAVIAHFTKTVNAAQGCKLEIAQRDVYQISDSPDKVRRYVQLIRQCCEKHKY